MRTEDHRSEQSAGRDRSVGASRPLVMGVLNVTPDSFSDGGLFADPSSAIERARQMIEQGADVIDVGGESTRPGAQPVDPADEARRVLPVIDALVALTTPGGVRISVDTRNASTATSAVECGATLINDVSATLWPVAAELGVGWVAMHMLGDPRTMQDEPFYDDVVDDVRRFLVGRATTARDAGVDEIWLDPGIGFGKTTRHNLDLLARLDELVDEGFPVMIGTSRKRFTGVLTAASDGGDIVALRGSLATANGSSNGAVAAVSAIDDRSDASLATGTWAMLQGARMVRTHDVGSTVQASIVVAGGFPVG